MQGRGDLDQRTSGGGGDDDEGEREMEEEEVHGPWFTEAVDGRSRLAAAANSEHAQPLPRTRSSPPIHAQLPPRVRSPQPSLVQPPRARSPPPCFRPTRRKLPPTPRSELSPHPSFTAIPLPSLMNTNGKRER
ncbi:hypothetical protein TIFTF001_028523 [Ficus carica]|uniref:Uncharacterized protein n=1 Tax=Ficus carica TaxID=3494 RepID=A0AA88DPX3_FICCA|nr:hypothetical protein TIFTF001_028523 [Ficus carica]